MCIKQYRSTQLQPAGTYPAHLVAGGDPVERGEANRLGDVVAAADGGGERLRIDDHELALLLHQPVNAHALARQLVERHLQHPGQPSGQGQGHDTLIKHGGK